MSQDEGSCPKNEKTDMQFGPFIGMWVKEEQAAETLIWF